MKRQSGTDLEIYDWYCRLPGSTSLQKLKYDQANDTVAATAG